MHLDVVDLRSFYYRTQLGRVAQRAIRDQLVAVFPPTPGQTVVGFGFAVPLLRPYLQDAARGLAHLCRSRRPRSSGLPAIHAKIFLINKLCTN